MRDIVDSCRVWESHAEVTDSWGGGQEPEYPLAIYQVVEDSQPPVVLEESDVLDQTGGPNGSDGRTEWMMNSYYDRA